MPRMRKAARRESIQNSLGEGITTGKFPAGAFLPSEAELGRRYRVSRVTVRAALGRLREQGLIEAKPGVGWQVVSSAPGGNPGQGVAVLAVASHFAAQVFAGIKQHLERAGSGWTASLTPLEGGLLDAHPLTLWVSLENLAGLIFFSVRALPALWVDEIAKAKLPVVCTGCPEHASYDTVCTDNVRGMELLAAELLRRGHRRIGLVTSTDLEERDPCFHLRRIGFEQAMNRAGAQPTCIAAPHNYYVGPQEERLIGDWMDRERPTCLIGACDSIAVQLLTLLERRGLRVPHDISLAGFDHTREFDGVLPRFGFRALTTVAQPWQEIGRLAAQRLLARRRGEDAPPTLTLIPPAVIAGDSVKDLA